MGLEVEGSTPSIYPIFSKWSIDIDLRKPTLLKLHWLTIYLSILKRSMPDAYISHAGHGYSALCISSFIPQSLATTKVYRNNPIYTNFLTNEFKAHYKKHRTVRSAEVKSIMHPVINTQTMTKVKLLLSFKSYLRVNSASTSTITIPHFSFKHFYLGYRRGGNAVLNINKFFTRWKDTYYLTFNLFYYEIDLLTFGTSFFKSEILSLNWQSMNKFKFMWRYTRPFLALRPNKITTYGDFVFYRLSLLGMRIGLVVDILYHTKTIYYLHRSGFYTIGLVPINHNISSLNFAIPSTSDSVLSQVFFIRFTSLIQQSTSTLRYNTVRKLWSSNN